MITKFKKYEQLDFDKYILLKENINGIVQYNIYKTDYCKENPKEIVYLTCKYTYVDENNYSNYSKSFQKKVFTIKYINAVILYQSNKLKDIINNLKIISDAKKYNL